jgi:hypothetical protein
MTEVKRYSVQAGFVHETAHGTYCKFSDHDRLVSSLREEVERLKKAITTALDEECNDPFRVLRSAMEKPE